jgi:EAL domain-containing protein (putative c-di-GMP-specific phosphodiesterase class I)
MRNQFLYEVAKKIKICVRKIDTITHLNDGRFLFLLPQLVKPETAAYVSQRIMAKLKTPFKFDNKLITLQGNIGISIYPFDGDELNLLIAQAEKAYNNAKMTDEPYLFFNETLQKISKKENQITTVILNDDLDKKIISYCIPQVDSSTKKIIGLKVIPYIKDEKMGLISYDQFMKAAENENKLSYIYSIFLSETISQLKDWTNQSPTQKRIVINVNAKLITDEKFIDTVKDIFKTYQFNPSCLTFEINAESFSSSEDLLLPEMIEQLKQLGVQICLGVYTLGNLGTKQINNFSFNYLKIDERVVKKLASLSENDMMLNTLLDLSHIMGLETLVEGVDTVELKNILQKLGFKNMQGKLFGSLQPVKTFPKNHSVV